MSAHAYQELEYEATIAPWLKPVEVLDANVGRVTELFGLSAFHNAERDPTTVPIVYRHGDEPVEVGHLVALEHGTSWIKGRFQLFDNLVGLHAAEQLERGSPVSIEYTPRRTLNRVGLLDCDWHIEANLDAIAIGIGRSAYDTVDGGARIIGIRERPRPPRAAPSPTSPGRPSSTSASAPREHLDEHDRAQRQELAARGILVRRNVGTVLEIR
jgi:hypothetical protein